MTTQFIHGYKACVEGALAAGVRFFAGYPITPSTEIAELMSKHLPKIGGKFIQMEDEIASMGAILGASLAGSKSMTATSGPGFSLKQELIGFACLCEIPCVIINVQRGGPSTGLPTLPAQGDVMQARWGTHGDHPIIALSPSSIKEMYDLTITAVNFSEKYRLPVILLTDEVITKIGEKFDPPNPKEIKLVTRTKPNVPPDKYFPCAVNKLEEIPAMANFGEGYRYNVTGLIHDKTGFPTPSAEETEKLLKRLHQKIEARKDEIILIDTENLDDAKIVLFSYGASARSARSAMKAARNSGIKVGMIKTKTIWPFPKDLVSQMAKKVKTIIVVEMNLGQIVHEVECASRGQCQVVGVNIARGELMAPQEILTKIKEV